MGEGGIIYPRVDDGGGASVRIGPRMELPQVLQVGKEMPISGDALRRGRDRGREGGREGGGEGEFM